jgi:hypothetical protein
MPTYRYRIIRTMFDKAIGVAVQPPEGGLLLRLGQRDLDFDKAKAPKLESLDFYIDQIAAKPEYKALQIDNYGKIREINLDRFISLALFMQKVQHLTSDDD